MDHGPQGVPVVLSLVAVLSFAIYRVTRFLVADSLIREPRGRLLQRLAHASNREGVRGAVADKLHDLLICPYCISVWVTAATVAATDAFASVPLPLLTGAAAAGGAMAVWRFVEE